MTAIMMDIMAGKTRSTEKTKKLRGKSIVRGGLGAASRTVGLLGGIFTYSRPIGDTIATVRLGIENVLNDACSSSAARNVTLSGPRTVKLSLSLSL